MSSPSFSAASLLEDLDKKLLVVLRDGRKLVGVLRSVDQFGTTGHGRGDELGWLGARR